LPCCKRAGAVHEVDKFREEWHEHVEAGRPV